MNKYNFKDILSAERDANRAFQAATLKKRLAERAGMEYLSLLTGRKLGNFLRFKWAEDDSCLMIFDFAAKKFLKVTEADLEKTDEEVIAIYESNKKAYHEAGIAKTARDRKMLYLKLKAEFEGDSNA